MKVLLSDAARAYLRHETLYLRARSPAAARAFTARMRKARQNLSDFENLGSTGRALPIPGLRRLVAGDYLLDYEVRDGAIHVLSVRHGRQLPPETPLDDDVDYEVGLGPPEGGS